MKAKKKKFTNTFFEHVNEISKKLNFNKIENLALDISKIKKRKGRIFFLGVGGSAGNCGHAVNDFRKLCNIDAYTPVDNISEITAKTNDEGFETIFDSYLRLTNCCKNDLLMIFSVGGGHIKKNVSVNLIRAIKFAKSKYMEIYKFFYNNFYEYFGFLCIIRYFLLTFSSPRNRFIYYFSYCYVK